jgi:hypothetical protein
MLYHFLPVLFVGKVVESFVQGISCTNQKASWKLSMVVTPVGPFCPFRSTDGMAMVPRVEAKESPASDLTEEFTRIQKVMMMGQTPDAARLRKVADYMDGLVVQWEGTMIHLQTSLNFQDKEFAKLFEARVKEHGFSSLSFASMVRWQAGCMRSLANNAPPPMPPVDLDLDALVSEVRTHEGSGNESKVPSITAMQAAKKVTASPFISEKFESDLVKEEYEKLVVDHSNLINFGSKYNDFDPLEKISFLDQIEAIAERWDAFFLPVELMHSLNKEYIEQCQQLFASMKLTEQEYRRLLKESHRLMRLEAEREKDRPKSH